RQEEVEPLPTVKQKRRNDRIANEQPNDEEERAVTDAREYRDAGVSQKLRQTTPLGKVTHALRVKVREIKQQHCDHGRRSKEDDRSHQAGEILSDDKHFPSHRA